MSITTEKATIQVSFSKEKLDALKFYMDEKDTTVEKEDSWSLDDWNNDARERLKAFKQKIREIENAAWAKVEPYLLSKANFADEVADLLDAEAKPRYEQFGVPFVSPAYVMLLRRYAASLRDGSRRYVGKPSEMAGAL